MGYWEFICCLRFVGTHLSTFQALVFTDNILHFPLIDEHLVKHLHLLIPYDFDIGGQLQILPFQMFDFHLHGCQLLIL